MLAVIEQVFEALMEGYLEKVPYARQAIKIIQGKNDSFVNDHVAFRSFGMPNLGIASLEKPFIHLGYTKMERMYFEDKKLNAYWYRPPHLSLPKVFISELIVSSFPESTQSVIKKYTDPIESDPNDQISIAEPDKIIEYLDSRPWAPPSYADYQSLNEASEYAAWVLAYGNRVNHFTISVNALANISNIQALNDLFLENEIPMNTAGGLIKGSPAACLMQSSTVANQMEVEFLDGTHSIPYSYMEFAERFVEPQYYFQGFIPKNADMIFESTYAAQVNKTNPT